MTREEAIRAASELAFEEDAEQVVGIGPTGKWEIAHIEDAARIDQLTNTVRVNAEGEITE